MHSLRLTFLQAHEWGCRVLCSDIKCGPFWHCETQIQEQNHSLLLWHWAHSTELLTFTAMQVKHGTNLDDGPGEESPWHIWCLMRQCRCRGGDPLTLLPWQPRCQEPECATGSVTASSHVHPVLQPWRGSSPALLVALVVTAALHGSVLSLLHVLCDAPALQAVLVCSQPWARSVMKWVLPALAGDVSWFLRLTGRFTSLTWLTGPYLQLTRWSPDLDTRIFVLRGWASKGNV